MTPTINSLGFIASYPMHNSHHAAFPELEGSSRSSYLDGYASAVERLRQILNGSQADIDTVGSWVDSQAHQVQTQRVNGQLEPAPCYKHPPCSNCGHWPGSARPRMQYNVGPDVLDSIFKHLPSRDRHSLMTTCRAFLSSGLEGFVREYEHDFGPEHKTVTRNSAEDFIRWLRFVLHQPQERIPLIRYVHVNSTRNLEPEDLHWLRLQMLQILHSRGPKLQSFHIDGAMSLDFILRPDNMTYDITSMELHSGNEKDILDDIRKLFSGQVWAELVHFKIVAAHDCLEAIEALSAFAPYLQSLHVLSNLLSWRPIDARFDHVQDLVLETLRPLDRRGLSETFPAITSFTVRYYDSGASFNMNKKIKPTTSSIEWSKLRFLEGSVDNVYGLSLRTHVHHVRLRVQKPPGHAYANTYAQYFRSVLKTTRPRILELAYKMGEQTFSSFVTDALSEVPDGVEAISIAFIPKPTWQQGLADHALIQSFLTDNIVHQLSHLTTLKHVHLDLLPLQGTLSTDMTAMALSYIQQVRSLLHVCINFHDQEGIAMRMGWGLRGGNNQMNNLQLIPLEAIQRQALSMQYFGKDYSSEDTDSFDK